MRTKNDDAVVVAPKPSQQAAQSASVLKSDSSGHSQALSGYGDFAYQAANFSIVVGATSTVITLVQNPMNVMLLNYMQYSKFLMMPTNSRLGFLAAAQRLYAGLLPNLAGSNVKGVLAVGSKKTTTEAPPVEGATDVDSTAAHRPRARQLTARDVGMVSAFAVAETAVSQIPDNRAMLAQLGLPKVRWNVHNVYVLNKLGVGSRLTAASINFSALCMLQEQVVDCLPPSNPHASHFFAGTLSGMMAGGMTYPLNAWRESYIAKTTVDSDGNLKAHKFKAAISDVADLVKQEGLNKVAVRVMRQAAVQVPLRAARTGVTMGLVAGMGSILTHDPLGRVLKRTDSADPGKSSALGVFSKSAAAKHADVTDNFEQAERLYDCGNPFA